MCDALCLHPLHPPQESDDEDVGDAARAAGAGVGERPGGGAAGAKGDGVGHTAMVADILKEKEKAEIRAKEADAESKGRGDGQVREKGWCVSPLRVSTFPLRCVDFPLSLC